LSHQLVSYEVSGLQNMTALSWYDSYHLLTNQNGRSVLMEYDGANITDFGLLSGTGPAYSSADAKSIVAFRPEGVGVALVSILLKP
jgi:hypothetical protein